MHETVLAVFVVTGLLGLVSLLQPLAARHSIPITVLLAAVGTAIGVAAPLLRTALGRDGAPLAEALAVVDLPAEAFLLLFLPTLLFETALSIDVRRLMDDLAPVLVMAIVAVVLSTGLTGLVLYGIGAGSLVACLLIGAILATTDPAAVVGIFRDIGAPKRLSTLVEGESLLNDAAAIAMFGVLLAVLIGSRAASWSQGLNAFVVGFAGGIAFGYALARGICALIGWLRAGPLVELTLTFVLAYLAYAVGEKVFHVSGVVAVVAAGLTVSAHGRTQVSAETWHSLEQLWKQLGFWANSLIFLLAAMVMAPLLMKFGLRELGWLAAVVAATLVARAVVLFGIIPLLSMAGLSQRIDHAYKTVILWGGLRGAVSLALALAVMETRRVPADAKAMIGIVATSFVLYTLFAHGLTLRPLIGLLGLNRLSPRELAVRNRAMALALADSREHVRAVAEEHDLSHGVRDEAEAQFGGRLGTLEQSLETDCALDEDARMEMGLVTLAGREERLYLGLLDENLVSRQVVQRLRAIAGRLGDGARSAGRDGYLRAAVAALDHAQGFRFAIWASRHLRWHRPLRSLLSQRFEMLMASRVVLRDLVNFAENRLGALLGAAYAGRIVAVLNDRRFAVEQALEALRQQFPDYARGLERGYVGRAALRQELAAYRALHEEGVISQDVLNDLEREVGHRWRVFEMVPTLDLGLDAARLVARVPMFAGLGAASLQNIARHLRPGLAMPDEVLVRRGERGEEMYFVASGEVEVRNPDTLPQPIRLGAGDFFGELALLTRQPRSADVVALTYCQLLVLDRRAVTQLFREDPSLRDHIRAVAQNRMAAERAAE